MRLHSNLIHNYISTSFKGWGGGYVGPGGAELAESPAQVYVWEVYGFPPLNASGPWPRLASLYYGGACLPAYCTCGAGWASVEITLLMAGNPTMSLAGVVCLGWLEVDTPIV